MAQYTVSSRLQTTYRIYICLKVTEMCCFPYFSLLWSIWRNKSSHLGGFRLLLPCRVKPVQLNQFNQCKGIFSVVAVTYFK